MASLKEVRRGKNFVVYSDGKDESILLKGVTFSYPHFGSKHEQKDEKTGNVRVSWNGVAMLPKATHSEAKDALNEIITKVLARNENAKVARDKRSLRDGDADDEGDIPAEYQKHWYVSFAENANKPGAVRPPVRNEFGKLMIDVEKAHDPEYVRQAVEAIDTKFYGGCKGNVLIRPWYFNGKAKGDSNTYPKRVSSGYSGVQFTEDGKPFGQGRIDTSNAAWDSGGDDDGMGSGSSSGSSSGDDDL